MLNPDVKGSDQTAYEQRLILVYAVGWIISLPGLCAWTHIVLQVLTLNVTHISQSIKVQQSKKLLFVC